MNLKNRIVAVVTAAAIALPAIAFAKHALGDGASSVSIEAHAPAVNFTGKLDRKSIWVTDDGTNTVIKFDGFNIDTGMPGRNDHMKKQVFMNKETKYQYWEIIIPNAAIAKGLTDHVIEGRVKSGWTKKFADEENAKNEKEAKEKGTPPKKKVPDTQPIRITDFKKSAADKGETKVEGTINTSLTALKVLGKVCLIGGAALCVDDALTIKATIFVKE